MLAGRGYTGPKLNAEPWWKTAVFYRIAQPPDSVDFKSITARLDSMRALGIDALLLPAPPLPAAGSGASMPNLDDLDNLLRQASSHGIRVLLTIQPPSATADISGLARFWLTRGVAGLHIATPAGATPEQMQAAVQALRKLESSTPGQRIVISDQDLTAASADSDKSAARRTSTSRSSRASDSTGAQLQIEAHSESVQTLDAASLRPVLAAALAQPSLLLDLHAPGAAAQADARPPLANAVAAIAALSRPSVLIDSRADLVFAPAPEHPEPIEPAEPPKPAPLPPQPPPGVYLPYVPYVPPAKPKQVEAPKPVPTDPLTSWYQKLVTLHHDNATLRTGSKMFFDFDLQNVIAWLSRPASPSPRTPPIVVLCNLSASPVTLSLSSEVKKLNLRGFYLRAMLRSDNGMGAQDLDAITLPPYSVYIGELRL